MGASNIGAFQILSIWFVEIASGAIERIASANMCAACVQIFSCALPVCAEKFFVFDLPSHALGAVVATATSNWLTTFGLIFFGALLTLAEDFEGMWEMKRADRASVSCARSLGIATMLLRSVFTSKICAKDVLGIMFVLVRLRAFESGLTLWHVVATSRCVRRLAD